MKDCYIFLDIDGVIEPYDHLDCRKNVVIFQRIVEAISSDFNPKIVLSSLWRVRYDQHEMDECLRIAGYSGPPICDTTPEPFDVDRPGVVRRFGNRYLWTSNRSEEIMKYLEGCEGEFTFIVLDDDTTPANTILREGFLQTQATTGLQDSDYSKAVSLPSLQKTCTQGHLRGGSE